MIHTQMSRHQFFIFIITALLVLPFVFENTALAQTSDEDVETISDLSDIPPFELGIGGGGLMMNSPPQWISDHYIQAFATLSCRIFAGLYIEGGKDVAGGGDIDEEWINVSSYRQVFTNRGTNKYGTWAGARYEFNIQKSSFNVVNADAVYIGGGIAWVDINVRTKLHRSYDDANGWDTDGPAFQEYNSKTAFKAGDLKGYYIAAAGRWRLDTRKTAFSTPHLGHYGVDAGFRYTAYNDYSGGHESLESAENLSSLQIFFMVYLKMGLFD